MPDPTTYPQAAMKIGCAADDDYDLMSRAVDGSVQVFARAPINRQDEPEAYHRCELLSASFLMVHALSMLIDWAQPEDWPAEESPAWHNALVAFGTTAETNTREWIAHDECCGSLGPTS
jgi:hypothetical protein